MYVTSRTLTITSAADMPQAVGLINFIINHINSNHGTDLAAATMVGGDPSVIRVNGRYESLADYQKLGMALQSDAEYQSVVQLSSHLFADVQDTIWNVRIPPGEAQAIITVNNSRVNLTRVGEAMTFAAEAAATIGSITGSQVGVATAMTGDQTRLIWAAYSADLGELEADNDKIESSEDYLDLFKRSEGLFIPGHFDQSIWMRVSP